MGYNYLILSTGAFTGFLKHQQYTPPKFNMAPEKWWLEDDPFLFG